MRRIARLLCLVAATLAAACGSPPEAPLPAGSVVLVIGDSISAGYGVEPDDAWPARLAQRTGWHIVAAGINGDRTSGGRERLPGLMDEHRPALVLIELGGNDLLRGIPAAQISRNLDAMIANARSGGARVALMAAPQPSMLGAVTGLAAASLYADLAKLRNVPLIEKALPSVLSDEDLRQDAIHPNAAGHGVLAERAFDELTRSGVVATP